MSAVGATLTINNVHVEKGKSSRQGVHVRNSRSGKMSKLLCLEMDYHTGQCHFKCVNIIGFL